MRKRSSNSETMAGGYGKAKREEEDYGSDDEGDDDTYVKADYGESKTDESCYDLNCCAVYLHPNVGQSWIIMLR